MPLSDQQIERYSRQILVAGGVAQERLLAAGITITGTAALIEAPLRYLVGAGVGRIGLDLIGADSAARNQLIAMARVLDSRVAIQNDGLASLVPDLRLVIIGDAKVLATVESRRVATLNTALVAVRLDRPAKILVQPKAWGFTPALEAQLLARLSPGAIADEAGFVTMVAATEVLKLIMQPDSKVGAKVIHFDGYQTQSSTFAGH